MAKRPLKVKTSLISKTEFMRLQDTWDAKLRRSGFEDIEFGQDTNLIDGSTFRGYSESGGHGIEVVIGAIYGDDPGSSTGRGRHYDKGAERYRARLKLTKVADQVSIFDAPRARAWAIFSQGAHEIPKDRWTRDVLVEVADCGSYSVVAKRRRVSTKKIRRPVYRLCDALGISPHDLFGAVASTQPDKPEAPPWWCKDCRNLGDNGQPGRCGRHGGTPAQAAA